jgi:hypothetical protein
MFAYNIPNEKKFKANFFSLLRFVYFAKIRRRNKKEFNQYHTLILCEKRRISGEKMKMINQMVNKKSSGRSEEKNFILVQEFNLS